MSEHECIIGLLYNTMSLVTLQELKDSIEETKEYNRYIWNQYPGAPLPVYHNEYTLKDYCDKRKSTNLTRFEFCPMCGKKIDWKKIKNEETE